MSHHAHRSTLSVLVENRPGVLARISGMFSRRGYNIHSLTVGPTEDPLVSRLTIVVNTEGILLEQITKQLNKLIHVLKIVDLDPVESVERELQLVKVDAPPEVRSQIIELADVFDAHIVDVDHESIIVEAAGRPSELERLLALLEPFGIREMVRSGTIAMGRGSRSITDGQRTRMQRVV